MIWRTEEGYPFVKIVPLYGRLVDSSGQEFKQACEARWFFALPLAGRRREMELTATKRGGRDAGKYAASLAELERIVLKEWQWRRDEKAAAA